MTRQNIFLLPAALTLAALMAILGVARAQTEDAAANSGAPSAEQSAPASDVMAEGETPEQAAARELCTETAADGAHPGWKVRERMTCENSFIEVCRVARDSDGVEESYTCYEPLPMPEAPEESGGA